MNVSIVIPQGNCFVIVFVQFLEYAQDVVQCVQQPAHFVYHMQFYFYLPPFG